VSTVTTSGLHRYPHSLAKNFTKSRFRAERRREWDLAAAGFQFTASVILSVFLGIWLDKRLGTTPWLLVVTVFLGAAIGFHSLYRNIMQSQRLGDRRQGSDRREERH
jgi:ATP synthase protein I